MFLEQGRAKRPFTRDSQKWEDGHFVCEVAAGLKTNFREPKEEHRGAMMMLFVPHVGVDSCGLRGVVELLR